MLDNAWATCPLEGGHYLVRTPNVGGFDSLRFPGPEFQTGPGKVQPLGKSLPALSTCGCLCGCAVVRVCEGAGVAAAAAPALACARLVLL